VLTDLTCYLQMLFYFLLCTVIESLFTNQYKIFREKNLSSLVVLVKTFKTLHENVIRVWCCLYILTSFSCEQFFNSNRKFTELNFLD
jgi:uncharacterized membrane protein (DUF106 family)